MKYSVAQSKLSNAFVLQSNQPRIVDNQLRRILSIQSDIDLLCNREPGSIFQLFCRCSSTIEIWIEFLTGFNTSVTRFCGALVTEMETEILAVWLDKLVLDVCCPNISMCHMEGKQCQIHQRGAERVERGFWPWLNHYLVLGRRPCYKSFGNFWFDGGLATLSGNVKSNPFSFCYLLYNFLRTLLLLYILWW